MSIMKAFAPVSLFMMLAGAGCATNRAQLVLDRVGPSHEQPNHQQSQGTLIVHTAPDESPHFYGGDYHRWYSDYEVLSDDGRIVRKVTNDTGTVAGGPAGVKLTPGNYQVKARANRYGLVTVPVLIEPQRITTVHLDGGGTPGNGDEVVSSNSVRLPRGEIVGWRVPTNTPAGEPRHVATAGQESK
jgi:hypothetical protein